MNKNKTQDEHQKTTQKKEKHEQQILFQESELSSLENMPETSPLTQGQQVVFDNRDYLPVEVLNELPNQFNDEATPTLDERKKPRWLWRFIFLLFMIIITIETVDFFITGFTQNPFTASLYAIILSCLILVSSTALFREISGLKQFNRRQELKQKANNYLTSNSTNSNTSNGSSTLDVEQFCQQITASLPCDLLSEQEESWQKALNAEHSQEELLKLYSRLILHKVDDKALAEITKFSTEAIVLVALSPIAIVDMLIMLWRNLRMINKVSGLYGLKLGYWSRIKLIKQVFVNMVYAGASELISDFGTEMIGADLLGKLSGRLAQGLGAGMLTARLGIKTMQLCRPIPFEDKPKLGHVRNKMLGTIKGLLNTQKSN